MHTINKTNQTNQIQHVCGDTDTDNKIAFTSFDMCTNKSRGPLACAEQTRNKQCLHLIQITMRCLGVRKRSRAPFDISNGPIIIDTIDNRRITAYISTGVLVGRMTSEIIAAQTVGGTNRRLIHM